MLMLFLLLSFNLSFVYKAIHTFWFRRKRSEERVKLIICSPRLLIYSDEMIWLMDRFFTYNDFWMEFH